MYDIDNIFGGVSDILDNFAQDFTNMGLNYRPVFNKTKEDKEDSLAFNTDTEYQDCNNLYLNELI